jgi:hypothetical protein
MARKSLGKTRRWENYIEVEELELDETGSGSCPLLDFGNSCV